MRNRVELNQLVLDLEATVLSILDRLEALESKPDVSHETEIEQLRAQIKILERKINE